MVYTRGTATCSAREHARTSVRNEGHLVEED